MTSRRRFVIAAGTARYDHLPPDRQLPSVADDVALVSSWFVRHGFEHVLPELGDSPPLGVLREALSGWFSDPDRTAQDVVVLYYSGHGETVDRDAHYLITRDTRFGGDGPLPLTALPHDDLARVVALSPIQHALVIVDTCYSGEAITGFSAKAGALRMRRRGEAGVPDGVYLISASRPRQKAKEHVFASTFVEVIENADGRFGGRTQAFLEPNDVVGGINARFKARAIRQQALWIPASPLAGDVPEIIPNPRFEPGRPADLAVADAWLPGIDDAERAAEQSYFTGRERAVRELTAWLAAAPDGRARVITGGPGTGKSALVRRVVSLAHADVVVNARGKTAADVRAALADVPNAPPSPGDPAQPPRPLTIVVDALDEAKEPRQIARDVLRDLAPRPTVRLLVASRPEGPFASNRRRVTTLGTATIEIDLDDPDYLGATDVEDYVARWLLADGDPERRTPYRGQPALAHRVARVVAERAGAVFLVARIVARTLADRETVVDVGHAGWADAVPDDVGRAFDQFLGRFDDDPGAGLSTAAVRDLLLPLAFSEGAGLPRGDTWAAVASALAGKEYLDDDVATVLRHAGPYIVEGSEQGRSVYRLYHALLASHLRAARDEKEAQRRVSDALVALVPVNPDGRRDWTSADAYVQTHLAAHAARAGSLGALLDDHGFLAVADPPRLARELPDIVGGRPGELAETYERVSHRLQGRTAHERAAYLRLAALQHGDTRFAASLETLALDPPWTVRWARWAPGWRQRVLWSQPGEITHALGCERDGHPCVLAASRYVHWTDDGRYHHTLVFVYDLARGALAFPPIRLQFVSITSLAIARVGGDDAIVAHASDATLHAWRLEDGAQLGEPLALGARGLGTRDPYTLQQTMAIGVVDGRPVACVGGPSAGGSETLLDAWDIERGAPAWPEPVRFPGSGDVALAAAESNGQWRVVSAEPDGMLRIRNLTDGAATHEIQDRPLATVSARSTGEAITIVGGGGELITKWIFDGATLAPVPRQGAGHGDAVVRGVTMGELDGAPAFVSWATDNRVVAWSLSDLGDHLSNLLGATRTPMAAALVSVRGTTQLVSGDDSGALRAWSVRPPAAGFVTAGPLPGRFAPVERVDGGAIVALDTNRSVAAYAASDGTSIDRLTATIAPPLPHDPLAARPPLRVLTARAIDGDPVVAYADDAGFVRLTRTTGQTARVIDHETARRPRHLAIARWDDRHVLIVCDVDGWITTYDVTSGSPIGEPFRADADYRESRIAMAESAAGPILVCHGPARPFSFWSLAACAFLRRASSKNWGYAHAGACATVSGEPIFAAADRDGDVRLWQIETGMPHGGRLDGMVPDPRAVALAELDGSLVVAAGDCDGTLQVWRDGERIARVELDCEFEELAVLSDGGIAVGAFGGLLVLDLPR